MLAPMIGHGLPIKSTLMSIFHSPQAQIACEQALRGALAKTIKSELP